MDYTASKPIGPTFADEIAGLADRRFCWGPDGRFTIDDRMSPADVDALKAIIAAHDSTKTVFVRETITSAVGLDDVLRWALDEVNTLRAALPTPLPAVEISDARRAVEQLARRKER